MEDAISAGHASKGEPHPGESGGTGPGGRRSMLKDAGIPSSVQKTTKENLAAALKRKKGVIVNVDAGTLWGNGQSGGHAIVITQGDFGDHDELKGIFINDTGADQQGRYMPIDDFMDAADTHPTGSKLNVTDDPIWP